MVMGHQTGVHKAQCWLKGFFPGLVLSLNLGPGWGPHNGQTGKGTWSNPTIHLFPFPFEESTQCFPWFYESSPGDTNAVVGLRQRGIRIVHTMLSFFSNRFWLIIGNPIYYKHNKQINNSTMQSPGMLNVLFTRMDQ